MGSRVLGLGEEEAADELCWLSRFAGSQAPGGGGRTASFSDAVPVGFALAQGGRSTCSPPVPGGTGSQEGGY